MLGSRWQSGRTGRFMAEFHIETRTLGPGLLAPVSWPRSLGKMHASPYGPGESSRSDSPGAQIPYKLSGLNAVEATISCGNLAQIRIQRGVR